MLMKAQDSMDATSGDIGVPVSVKIRERIEAARKRFHSNDNIAAFIEPGELQALRDRMPSLKLLPRGNLRPCSCLRS